MLTQIIIKNFALIKSTEIDLNSGFNVITGETGAGKSIIINAAKLLLGGRASPDLIRIGEKKASVEGLFEIKGEEIKAKISELGVDVDSDELIIKRIISENRKNRVYINGSLFTLKTLSKIGGYLLHISSQHEFHDLLDPETHIYSLDKHCKIIDKVSKYSDLYNRYRSNKDRLKKLEREKNELQEKREFYQFMLKEIDMIQPKEGELPKIESELKILEHADEIKILYKELIEQLYQSHNSVYTSLNSAISRISQYQNYIKNGKNITKVLLESYYAIENVVDDLQSDSDSIDVDFEKLDDLRDRRFELVKLYKKYGGNEQLFFQRWNSINSGLKSIDNIDEQIESLKNETSSIEPKLMDMAKQLNKDRSEGAKKLNQQITKNLRKMGMQNSLFKVKIETDFSINSLSIIGFDNVEFMIRTNIDGTLKPIKQIASGGEMSRLLLAIKESFASQDKNKTYIFDEIDQGIGGETAHFVGDILRQLANRSQIIVITHLIQVASKADHHYLVIKGTIDKETFSNIEKLSSGEREIELARMIGDPDNDGSIKYVKNLLKEGGKHG